MIRAALRHQVIEQAIYPISLLNNNMQIVPIQ